jgi:hypothetical protein
VPGMWWISVRLGSHSDMFWDLVGVGASTWRAG